MKISQKSQNSLKILQKTLNHEVRKIPKSHYEKFLKEYVDLIKTAQRSDYLELKIAVYYKNAKTSISS